MSNTLHKRLLDVTTIEALRISGAVRRFHNHRYIIGEQTVAAHTYGVLCLMLQLKDDGPVTLGMVRAVVYHDAAEGEMGDIPAPTKWAYPELKAACDTAEQDVLERLGLNEWISEDDEWWLKACDWLEGLHFCLEQRRLGNVGIAPVFDAWVACMLDNVQHIPHNAWRHFETLMREWGHLNV